MIKQLKLGKNSFTLLETLISIFILSIIIVGFSNYSYNDNFDEEFMLLNNLENSFNTNSYDKNFTSSNKNLKVMVNDSEEKTIFIKEIKFKNEKVELIKYEL